MNKLTELSPSQQAEVAVYRARYFAQATSTEPADRARAEAAARRLAEIGGVEVKSISWVLSPEEGHAATSAARGSLLASLDESLWASLDESLVDSLLDSLRRSLRTSLRALLLFSLEDSQWDPLWDSPWLAYSTYAQDVLGVVYDARSTELLRLYNEVAASCFAVWIAPGAVVLCERPAVVEIEDGCLVGLTWRDEQGGEL